jgi:tetratricopeptide (TPR) repeat protein
MIFCESFIPHHCQPEQDQNFDRRDVYIITQNALADNTYLDYIRAQFNRSAQIDPPFFQNFLSGSPITSKFVHGPVRCLAWLDDIFEGLGARVERQRVDGTSWFDTDQFLSAQKLAAKLRHGGADPLAKFLYGKLSDETRRLVDSNADETALRKALSKDLNAILAGGNIYSPERFKDIKLPPLIQDVVPSPNLTANNNIRLNRRMLEEAYPDAIVKSLGGVYPDTEISTPSEQDSSICFNDYMADVQRRVQHDMDFPNERRQVRGDEDIRVDGGRLQVASQRAVMSINGLLTKVIFDKNPLHEFYVEESFPLDWMYPHLEPFGVIMKINRHPVREMSQETIDRDHAFWCEFSRRTIGNWITYDTTVKQVCDWVEEVYLRHDFTHFTGDRSFIRDDDAQKAFSKLRSSIAASIYLWRAKPENSLSAEERPRVAKEADFALKQAFAYCPYSPEAVFHYAIDLLVVQSSPPRVEDAILVLKTCHKLDPYNTQITDSINQLEKSKSTPALGDQIKQYFSRVQATIANGHTNEASQMLAQILGFAGSDPNTVMNAAECYARMGDLPNSEKMVGRLTELMPGKCEPWYNLATIQSFRGEYAKALDSLKQCLQINDAERQKNPQAFNMRKHMYEDPALTSLRQTREFQAAYGAKP